MTNVINLITNFIPSLTNLFGFLPAPFSTLLGGALGIVIVWSLINIILKIVGTFL